MNRWHAFRQLVLSRFREFYREPHAVFWVYGFPLLLATLLGVAFSGGEPDPPEVDVVAGSDPALARSLAKTLADAGVKAQVHDLEEAKTRQRQGRTALYLVPVSRTEIQCYFDKTRPDNVLARRWVDSVLAHAQGRDVPELKEKILTERGGLYIDFLFPGLIGMNLIGGGLFGIGFVLVDMRVRKLFKRLLATPMNRGDFLWAIMTARLFFLIPEMTCLLLIGTLVFGVPIKGSVLTVIVIVLVGSLAFAGIGLLVGSRTEKTETVSGLINLVLLPMYLLSGVFFSSRRFPDAIQPLIQVLPLTQVIDALREVMLEGRTLLDIGWRLAVLGSWAAVTIFLALRWFRWR